MASVALPHVWNMVRSSSYGKKAMKILNEYLGLDLNDDLQGTVLGPVFSRNATSQKAVNWGDFSEEYNSESSRYDGVST
jgi:hypothetical protein